MCINPRRHPSGLRTPCHQCWQCIENRTNDWVGRCIAEKETSVATSVVTLTYGGGDTPESRFLRKSDVIAYIKAIRNKTKDRPGYKVRYFYVGEYGSKKGRAHWHIVLFWQEQMPHRELRKNIQDEYWPHGYSFWDEADTASIRYAMKYINKNPEDKAQLKTLGMSKKPMLGSRFFAELAERYIAQGISPQKPFYKFRDVLDKHGKPVEFYMPPLVAERFIELYIAKYATLKPGEHWPHSDFVDKYHDKAVNYVAPIRHEIRRRQDAPWMAPPSGAKELFDEKLNAFYCVVAGERLFWSFDERGQREWRSDLVVESQAEKKAEAYAKQRASAGLCSRTLDGRLTSLTGSMT